MTDNEINKMCETIRTSSFFERYAKKEPWMSGSSTMVKPIQVWKHSVNIQLDARKCDKGRSDSFRSLFRRLKKMFPKITAGFWKSDGSCPSEYIIRFNDSFTRF